MEQKGSVHNVIPEKVVLTTESPPEIWEWRFRSKQAIVRHNLSVYLKRLSSARLDNTQETLSIINDHSRLYSIFLFYVS